ncbi:hypothetical protein GGI07_005366 [Coemansia sp. Benny D115]|nr:hypothetical protein GGI07_005366 [Coemansia sp. Benny D115]
MRTTRKEQLRSGSLKAFVHVGKTTEAPAAKDALAKTPVRMTRSKSAALASAGVEVKAAPAPAPVATRKRKLEAAAPAVEAAPKPVQKAAKTSKSATPKGKRATTINAYFSPKSKGDAAPEESIAAATNASVADSSAIIADKVLAAAPSDAPVVSMDSATPAASAEQKALQKAALDQRANALLGKLRGRKAIIETSAANERIEETRAIQANIREIRESVLAGASAAAPTVADGAAQASFESAKTMSSEDLHLRELRRQFVAINPRPNSPRALPREMRKLEELFQGLEHTVMFSGPRDGSGVIYHRVRKSVEVMAKRTFGWRELGQIVAVYPESYTYEAVATVHEGRRVTSVELRPRVKGLGLAVEMEQRREQFRSKLVDLVDAAHRAFLVARGYTQQDLDTISGWHPSFDVETTPAVTPIALPPSTGSAGTVAGSPAVASFDREKLKHLLGKAASKISAHSGGSSDVVDPKKTAVSAPVLAPAPAPASVLAPAAASLPTPTNSPVIGHAAGPVGRDKAKEKPVSKANALLERIRAKQRAKEALQKASAPLVSASTRTMHSRLPMVLETLSFMFYSERKSVLPFFYVADKLADSKNLDRLEASQHLVALSRLVPEWCEVQQESGEPLESGAEPCVGARLKVTRTVSMQEAKRSLESRISELN